MTLRIIIALIAGIVLSSPMVEAKGGGCGSGGGCGGKQGQEQKKGEGQCSEDGEKKQQGGGQCSEEGEKTQKQERIHKQEKKTDGSGSE